MVSKARWPNQGELSRKIVHIGTGPVIPLAWWLEVPRLIAVPLGVVITLGLLANHHWKFIPSIEDINRQSYGTITYGLAITLMLIIFWPNNAEAVCAGTLVMAFGDGLAGLIGRSVRSPAWKVFNQTKSLIGTLTMGIVSVSVLLILSMATQTPIQPFKIILISALALALEQISQNGIDNITVPIGTAYGWLWMTRI